MEETRISVREWQQRYKAGAYDDKARDVQIAAGWYDWFCPDDSLSGRLKKIAPVVMGITEPFILDNYYVWFKNNCPVIGPLYDDVRFELLNGQRDGKYFLVSRASPHEKKLWALTTERFGFKEPEYECQKVRDMVAYINRLGYELEHGITPDYPTREESEKNPCDNVEDTPPGPGSAARPSAETASAATLKRQILAIRDSGETNMLDVKTVQYIASREGYLDLMFFLDERRDDYWKFIMTGEEEHLA